MSNRKDLSPPHPPSLYGIPLAGSLPPSPGKIPLPLAQAPPSPRPGPIIPGVHQAKLPAVLPPPPVPAVRNRDEIECINFYFMCPSNFSIFVNWS